MDIFLRRKDELLTTRAGTAPNRGPIAPLEVACFLPFSQLIIRPDGKISQCCEDAVGRATLGDLSRQTLERSLEQPGALGPPGTHPGRQANRRSELPRLRRARPRRQGVDAPCGAPRVSRDVPDGAGVAPPGPMGPSMFVERPPATSVPGTGCCSHRSTCGYVH